MAQKIRKERITKVEWYRRGGFANSALFRRQSRGGAWRYYVDIEKDAAQRQSDPILTDLDDATLSDYAVSAQALSDDIDENLLRKVMETSPFPCSVTGRLKSSERYQK